MIEEAPTSTRADANRIALRVARSILEAAAPLSLEVEGARVEVEVERLPAPPWPERSSEGLDGGVDGPWPRPVRLACRWAEGRAELVMSADLGRGRGPLEQLVGLRVAREPEGQGLVWLSLPRAIRGRRDGERVSVGASVGAGIPSAPRAEAFAVRLPEGEVLPLPNDAFNRLVHIALLKLPLAAGAPSAADARPEGSRLARIYPLPGGVRRYKATLDALLAWIGEVRPEHAALREALERRWEVRGRAAIDAYLRLLEETGLVERDGGAIALSEAGRRHVEDPDAERLFERLHATYQGLLETLVLVDDWSSARQAGLRPNTPVDSPGVTSAADLRRLLAALLEKRWKTPNQVAFRRNWLLSLGLSDRTDRGDAPTPLGRQVLGAHAGEVAEIRRRVEDLLEEELEASFAAFDAFGEGEDDEGDEVTTPPPSRPDRASEREAPPAWSSDRLDLTADLVRPHLGPLELPDALLHRIAAALSSGKHLLLVGPPGTGKTELALALGAAARTEGYCHGVFSATASADWTTFDTIGGYALQKDGSLRFRPGVFLSALERWQWLLLDELNRTDVDRAFGELMTVLAGRSTTAPFALDDGRLVTIGPDARATHLVPRPFRVLATMNTWDKTSLFRLSYAVQRRFAIVHVGVPDDAGYARLLRLHAARGDDGPLDAASLGALLDLFRSTSLFAHRAVGPAIPLDMIRYVRRRGDAREGLAEALAMYLLPQLEGLEPAAASAVHALLDGALAPIASDAARAELSARYRELFPLAKIG